MLSRAYKDYGYLSHTEWVSNDYSEFIKNAILPSFHKRYPLKLRELRMLLTIFEFNASKTPGEVAQYLRQDPATITRCMVSLIGNGYMVSKENFNDGRSRLLAVTEKGDEAGQYFFELFEIAMSTLPEAPERTESDTDIMQALETLTHRTEILHKRKKQISSHLQTHSARTQ